jgi:hypothetical protein
MASSLRSEARGVEMTWGALGWLMVDVSFEADTGTLESSHIGDHASPAEVSWVGSQAAVLIYPKARNVRDPRV